MPSMAYGGTRTHVYMLVHVHMFTHHNVPSCCSRHPACRIKVPTVGLLGSPAPGGAAYASCVGPLVTLLPEAPHVGGRDGCSLYDGCTCS